jgi:LysR family transcriptional regulator of gallate degradation
LLTSSDRITLLTRQEMEQEASLGSLVTLPFFPPKTRSQDGLATRCDWQPTPIQARFLALLRLHRPRSDQAASGRRHHVPALKVDFPEQTKSGRELV